MKVVEMRLTKKVSTEREKNWDLHQEIEGVGKPKDGEARTER